MDRCRETDAVISGTPVVLQAYGIYTINVLIIELIQRMVPRLKKNGNIEILNSNNYILNHALNSKCASLHVSIKQYRSNNTRLGFGQLSVGNPRRMEYLLQSILHCL